MKEQTKSKFLYIGVLVLILAALGSKMMPLSAAACVLLPPYLFSVLQNFRMRTSLLLGILSVGAVTGLGYVLYHSLAVGLMLSALLILLPTLQTLFFSKTANLYDNIFYGGSIFIAFLALSAIVLAREFFGVWDIQGIFRAIENTYLESITVMEQLYTELLSAEQFSVMAPILEELRQNITELSFRLISMLLSGALVWYYLSLLWGKRIGKIADGHSLFIIPRGVGPIYIVSYILSLFAETELYYPLDVALTLLGYLFVISAVEGIANHPLRPKRRNLLAVLLLLAAYISKSLMFGIVYIVLLLLGIFTSSIHRPLLEKRKGSDDQ